MRITLLTDFGDHDGYVGAMKGVILVRAPHATIIDLAHHIPPGDLRHASYVLSTTAPFFPPRTCHCAVVDPGVGTQRRAIGVAVDEQFYVAPDNGILSDVLAAAAGRITAVELNNPAFWQHPVSPTFHGRDIFAPVAAHVAAGVPLTSLGRQFDAQTLVRLPRPVVEPSEGQVVGEVIYLDRFGNAVTSLTRQHVAAVGTSAEALDIVAGDQVACRLADTYARGEPGQALAVIGSSGRLEIAVRGESAGELFGLQVGSPVVVRLR